MAAVFAKELSVLAVAVAAALAVLGTGSAANQGAWLVFSSAPTEAGPQLSQLARVRLSGSGFRQVTTGARHALDPSFARDGRHIAFTRLSSGLFLINIDGSGLRRLTRNGSDRFPVYSPSGRVIAFIRAAKGSGYHVWVMNANGRHQHRLRSAPKLSSAIRAAWMPDGRSLVIATGGAFYTISAATGKVQKQLTPTYDASLDPLGWSLSPNGNTIAYIGRRAEPAGCQGAQCEVFALYLQGVTSTKPKRAIADAGLPGWSPDSRHIVYPHGGLVVQAVAGGETKTISLPPDTSVEGDAPPAWQPR
jgi:Tol biopolymer transport system component